MRTDTLCPIARAASCIADDWTILILRELRLGNDRFDGIQAQTGISSQLLVRRLKAMEADGLVTRDAYQQRPTRYAYRLTARARELDGIMLLLRQWGMRHGGLDPKADSAVTMIQRGSGVVIDANWTRDGKAAFSFAETESWVNPGWAAERAARADSFNKAKQARVRRRRKASDDCPD